MTHKKERRIAADIGILVVDMEQSLRFYRDLLILPIVAEILDFG